MDAKNIACSACYGSGYGVDQKPCPCGCRPAPAPAIAPPVAAGRVDKGKIDDLLVALSIAAVDVSRGGHSDIHHDAVLELINAIDAWGAQQREQGKAEQTAFLKECTDRGQAEFNRKWTEQKERAEKAEARATHNQSIIDRLMLEYCPNEMTPEQVENWGKHQVRASDNG